MVQNITRQISNIIEKDINKKMVLLSGPRQCGKTTFAQTLGKTFSKTSYYSWDQKNHKAIILDQKMDALSQMWIFDEIHKYRGWRNWLKGVFDEFKSEKKILVTGSAKLQVYSYGGDSLQGRYFPHRLHPFTLSEVLGIRFDVEIKNLFKSYKEPTLNADKSLKDLLVLGGFPEPFLSGNEREAARWRKSYGERLVQEEIRSLQKLNDLDRVELMFNRLGDLIGSPLSIENLRKDLDVSFHTAKSWLKIFEKTYGIFTIQPFGPAKIKAVKKESKLYYWDWSRVEKEAARLENLVAVHLLRFVHWCEDVEGINAELRYFRNVDKKEVDFVVLNKGKPWFTVEVKTSDGNLDSNLKYFLERVSVPKAFQIVLNDSKVWSPGKINGCEVLVMPISRFLAELP